jgi:transcription antitermination protein NusB
MASPTPTPHTENRPPHSPFKSARRCAREIALQGLYEWLIAKTEVTSIEAHMSEQEHFSRCDRLHLKALLHGCIDQFETINGHLGQYIDRQTNQLSPIEHGVLMIGVYELEHCLDIPYKVVINEAVELAKNFGGTDGHKYVNGVLDKAAIQLRSSEVQARRVTRTP